MNFEDDLKSALSTLKAGGVILYPTDTIWGIGCDATNAEAIAKIYNIKQRSEGKSLILLIDNMNRIQQYVKTVPDIAYELIDVSDTPLTIIYPEGKNLPQNLLAEDRSIGIRVCRDNFCKDLIFRLRKPIVSTSANIGGQPAPANFYGITQEIISSVDYVVNYKQDDLEKHAPSPIIKIEIDGTIKIIRK